MGSKNKRRWQEWVRPVASPTRPRRHRDGAGLQESTADGLAKLAEVAENRAAKCCDKAHGDETEGWFNGVMGTGMNWMTGLMGMGLDSAVDTQGAAETGTDTVVATLNERSTTLFRVGLPNRPLRTRATKETLHHSADRRNEGQRVEEEALCAATPTNTDTERIDPIAGFGERPSPPLLDTFRNWGE